MNYDEEFRKRTKETIDFIADYYENIRNYPVSPQVKVGFLKEHLPDSIPEEGNELKSTINDFTKYIFPGLSHSQSVYNHAYYPSLTSPTALLADMVDNMLNSNCFTWASCPVATELECITTDWLGKMIGLPKEFLHLTPNGSGGGILQNDPSDAVLISMMAARFRKIEEVKEKMPTMSRTEIFVRLIAYVSDQVHVSVEKSGIVSFVQIHCIKSDADFRMECSKLRNAIKSDKDQGLIPFYVHASLGTYGSCSFDNLRTIGEICQAESMWLHVDARYAGTALLCPEYCMWLRGIEYANSFSMSPSCWMMANDDCSAMWVRDCKDLHRALSVRPIYLKHKHTGVAVDFMHWEVGLSRKFRALKLWFVIRNFGVKGLQDHVRKCVKLAKYFEEKVLEDNRFEIAAKRHLGVVVFRLKGNNMMTEVLLTKINTSGQLYCTPVFLHGKYAIHFCITSQFTTTADIDKNWEQIQECVSKECAASSLETTSRFGLSLLLSQQVMTPNAINASFVTMDDSTLTDDDADKILTGLHKVVPVLNSHLKYLIPTSSKGLDSQAKILDALDLAGLPQAR